MAIVSVYTVVCDGCDEEAPIEDQWTPRAAALAARAVGWYVCLAGSKRRWTRKGDALCPKCDVRAPSRTARQAD